MGHGYADHCEVCDGADPNWVIVRIGDVVMSWACDPHLAQVCDRLQRDFEVTELRVTNARKAQEWASIRRTLAEATKAPCSVCGVEHPVDPDGMVEMHDTPNGWCWCTGSGRTPKPKART